MTRLLLVIPAVAHAEGGRIWLDKDFSSNLAAYLDAFGHVTVLCPPIRSGGITPGSVVALDTMAGHARANVTLLPEPYREDRYLRHRRAVRRLIAREIDAATHLLFSPHAPFDWSTLAALTAIDRGRAYDMEADWDLGNVSWSLWRELPAGLNKLRKYAWIRFHERLYLKCMRHSAVALLQGGDVFAAYKDVAPNPHQVLNVQITAADRIDPAALAVKMERASGGGALDIVFAGRCTDMKGPREWLAALERAHALGVAFTARWFGGGDLLDEMRALTAASPVRDRVRFEGAVSRDAAMAATRGASLFLFCHKTAESPRNLVEALACAAPIVGFGSAYSRDLVAAHGGGAFAALGDVDALAALLARLHGNRRELSALTGQAFASASGYDRDGAIQARIALIKSHAG